MKLIEALLFVVFLGFMVMGFAQARTGQSASERASSIVFYVIGFAAFALDAALVIGPAFHKAFFG